MPAFVPDAVYAEEVCLDSMRHRTNNGTEQVKCVKDAPRLQRHPRGEQMQNAQRFF